MHITINELQLALISCGKKTTNIHVKLHSLGYKNFCKGDFVVAELTAKITFSPFQNSNLTTIHY